MPTPLPRVSYRPVTRDTRGFWLGGFGLLSVSNLFIYLLNLESTRLSAC